MIKFARYVCAHWNDKGRHSKLELFMDQIFQGMRLGTLIWRTRQGFNADQQCFLNVDHEHVLVYGRADFQFRGFAKSYDMYSNQGNDPRGDWLIIFILILYCALNITKMPNQTYVWLKPKTAIKMQLRETGKKRLND